MCKFVSRNHCDNASRKLFIINLQLDIYTYIYIIYIICNIYRIAGNFGKH